MSSLPSSLLSPRIPTGTFEIHSKPSISEKDSLFEIQAGPMVWTVLVQCRHVWHSAAASRNITTKAPLDGPLSTGSSSTSITGSAAIQSVSEILLEYQQLQVLPVPALTQRQQLEAIQIESREEATHVYKRTRRGTLGANPKPVSLQGM
jgi:hypothetical protein